jgi:hypothetical protein
MRMHQNFKAGNYSSIADYFQSLVKGVAFSANVKRNVLIMEALYNQGLENGIEEINIE